MFLKSETKTDRKPAVKITLQYKLSSTFCRKGKIACKKFSRLKRERDLSICCLLKESASILEQTSRLRRFEIRAFCDKMRPFCTISASIFWKIPPDILNLQTVLFRPLRSHQCNSEWFENWDMSIAQRAINTSHTDSLSKYGS